MKEEDIIKILPEIKRVEPEDSVFVDTLKERIIARREIVLQQKALVKARKVKIFDLRILFSSFAFMSIIAVAIVTLLTSSPNFNNQSSPDAQNNNDQNKNFLMEIGTEKVLAQEYDLGDLFVKLKLPKTWNINSENYDILSSQYPLFENESENIAVFSLPTTAITALENDASEQIHNYAVNTFTNDSELGEEIASLSPVALNKTNYLARLGNPDVYLLYSTDENNQEFIDAVLRDLIFSDPMSGWETYRGKNFSFKHSDKWEVSENQSGDIKISKATNYQEESNTIEFTSELAIINNAGQSSTDLSDVNIYGKNFQFNADDSAKNFYPENETQYAFMVTRSIISCNILAGEDCSKFIQDKGLEEDMEQRLIIWSTQFTPEITNDKERKFISDFGYEITYSPEVSFTRYLGGLEYNSVVEELYMTEFRDGKENTLNFQVFDNKNEDFLNDFQSQVGNIEWKSTPNESSVKFGDTDVSKTEGVAEMDNNLMHVSIYVYSGSEHSYVITTIYQIGQESGIENIIKTISFD